MSIAKQIREHIQSLPEGEAFHLSSLYGLGSPSNVRQVVCRMRKEGELTQVARGIFIRPKVLPYIGKVNPGVKEVVQVIEQTTGVTIAPHGAEAVRQLHLSTQMQMQPTFYTTGNSRNIKLGNRVIRLRHVSPRKMVRPGTIEGLVISALWYMNKKHVSLKTIEHLHQILPEEAFSQVLNASAFMPEWMANVFYLYKKEKHGH